MRTNSHIALSAIEPSPLTWPSFDIYKVFCDPLQPWGGLVSILYIVERYTTHITYLGDTSTHFATIHPYRFIMKFTNLALMKAFSSRFAMSEGVKIERADETTKGPVAFLWPTDRPWSAATDNTGPCGSPSVVGHRTGFPLCEYYSALHFSSIRLLTRLANFRQTSSGICWSLDFRRCLECICLYRLREWWVNRICATDRGSCF
jgi:hypothetical protein